MKQFRLILMAFFLAMSPGLFAANTGVFLCVNGQCCTYCEYNSNYPAESCSFGPFCPGETIDFTWHRFYTTGNGANSPDCTPSPGDPLGGFSTAPTINMSGIIYDNGNAITGVLPNVIGTTSSLTFTTPGIHVITWGTPSVNPYYSLTIIIANNYTIDAGPDQTICAGQTTTIGNPSNPAILNYQWTGGPIVSGANSGVATVNPTTTTTYTVTGTSPEGCEFEDDVLVTVVGGSLSISGPTSACFGNTSTTLSISGSSPGTTFNWYSTNGGLFANSGTNTIVVPHNQPPGTYTYCCNVIDPSCGPITYCQTVTIEPLPVFAAISDGQVFCANDPIVPIPLLSLGSCTPVYSGPGITPVGGPGSPTGYQFNPATANIGNNTLTVNCGGCITTITVVVQAAPTPPPLPSSICATAAPVCWTTNFANLVTGPGITTSFTFPPFALQQCFNPAGLSGNVVISSLFGGGACPTNVTVNVYPPPAFTGILANQVFCASDPCISFNVLFSFGCVPTVTTSTPAALTGNVNTGFTFCPSVAGPGFHTFTLSCPDCAPQTITIYVSPNPAPPSIPTIFCLSDQTYCWNGSFGQTISGNGTSMSFPGSPFTPQFCFDPATAGVGFHTIQITNINGCVSSPLVVQVTAGPNVSAGPDVVVCTDDLCNSTVSIGMNVASLPGTTYQWSLCDYPGFSAMGLLLDNPTSAVTNIDICNPFLTALFTANEPCFNFCVEATDINGCTSVDTVEVCFTNPDTVQLNLQTTSLGCDPCSGVILMSNLPAGVTTVLVNTISTNVTYVAAGAVITGLCSGTYDISYVDNCVAYEGSITVVSTGFSIVNSTVTPACNGMCNGSILLTPQNGVAPYTYSWSPAQPAPGNNPTGLCPGDYVVKVEDANGCLVVLFLTVDELPPILADFSGIDFINCDPNACEGEIVLNSTNALAPYTISWLYNGVTSGTTLIDLCTGVYEVTLTDSLGCTYDTVIGITSSFSSSLSIGVAVGIGPCQYAATATIGGSYTPPIVCEWFLLPNTVTPYATGPSISGACPGIYVIVCTDANGCTVTDTVHLGVPAPPPGGGGHSGDRFTLSPNPTTGKCLISFDKAVKDGAIELRTLTGSLLKRIPINGQLRLNLDLESYESGTYMVYLISDEKSESQKLIKLE